MGCGLTNVITRAPLTGGGIISSSSCFPLKLTAAIRTLYEARGKERVCSSGSKSNTCTTHENRVGDRRVSGQPRLAVCEL